MKSTTLGVFSVITYPHSIIISTASSIESSVGVSIRSSSI